MIRNADLALYAAKGDGRGKHCFFEPAMHSEASDRQRLEADLRQALERDEIWVAFQPIVRAAGEEISGFEALARWNHPVRGPIGPDKFIPLAEECGMIGKIGQFVLCAALSEAASWPDAVRIAVNVSPIQFNGPSIVEIVATAISETKIRAGRVELEITESVFLGNSDATEITFARLKALGVRLALDDFGTGYSSLNYLKEAPFDEIKIDQSFVRGAASSTNRNSAIIRAIVAIDGRPTEIRLRNLSTMGALVECEKPLTPGKILTIDIVGVGPVSGMVRWAHANKFGLLFTEKFDMTRLAPRQEKRAFPPTLSPWPAVNATGRAAS